MRRHRQHALAVRRLGTPGEAQHLRLRRTINVRVQQADACALRNQRQRQIYRSGGFADPTLARRNCYYVLHAGYELYPALHAMRNDFAGDIDLHSANTRYAFELVDHLLAGWSLSRFLPGIRARCPATHHCRRC